MKNTKTLTFIALFAALISALSPLSIPVGVVPITLATFSIYLTGALLKPKSAVCAVCIYILLGSFGMPIFAGFKSGFGVLLGVTGGFILGYVPMVIVESVIISKLKKYKCVYAVAMIVATAVLYVFGTVWFIALTKYSLKKAVALCVAPFLVGDAVKIIAAAIVSPTLNKALSLVNNKKK